MRARTDPSAMRYRIEVCEPTSLLDASASGADAFERVWQQIPIGADWRGHVLLDRDGGLFLKANQIPVVAGSQHWMRRFHIEREFRALARLERIGLPVARPLAMGIESRWGIPRRGFLIQSQISAAIDVERLLTGRPEPASHEPGLSAVRREEALAAAGALVRRLHRAGVYHGDLACRNLLVRPFARGFDAFAVDLPRARFAARGARGWHRRKDLYRLSKSALRCGASERELRALLDAAAGEDAARLIEVTRRIRAVGVRPLRKAQILAWRALGR